MKVPTLIALAGLFTLPFMNTQASDVPDTVSVRLAQADGNPGPVQTMPSVKKTDAQWRAQLGDAAFEVLRSQSTERPFCGTLLNNKKEGIYFCAGCGLPIFTSRNKFESGTGWPSFYAPFAKENIVEEHDTSYGWDRTEIHCARCGGHLGHVFNDGPAPTGLRYCLNSVSLKFESFDEIKADSAKPEAAKK